MQVDIYVREKDGNREIRFPILPEEFHFPGGEVKFVTSEIMNLGDVVFPSGTELATFSWESEFPGIQRKNDPLIRGKWTNPATFRSILEDWKRKGVKLNLLITGYPVNVDVYCKRFEPVGTGAFGDIAYEVEFIAARTITVTTTDTGSSTTKRSATSASRYTIKTGDTLWGIAVRQYGTGAKWNVVYKANKDIIEKTAKARGRNSSQNGHWIYPGVTLTIPKS